MEGIKTKTIGEFKQAVKHAKKFGISWIASNSTQESNWNIHKEYTVLIIDGPFLFFTNSKKITDELKPISINKFLKNNYGKDNT